MKTFLKKIFYGLPDQWRLAFKKVWYPHVLRGFREEQWPYTGFIRRAIKPGATVVDVGANIGYVSMLLSRQVGETGHVLSYEPVRETFQILQHNMRTLQLENVNAFNVALSAEEGTALMGIPQYAAGGENLYESHLLEKEEDAGEERAVRVEKRTLDGACLSYESVGFVKIDAEGHEWEVLRGGEKLIARDRPTLLIESGDDPADESTVTGRLFAWLKERRYQPYIWEEEELKPWQPGQTAVDYIFITEIDDG